MILREIHDRFGSSWVSPKQVEDGCGPEVDAVACMGTNTEASRQTRVGLMLRACIGGFVGDWTVEMRKDSHSSQSIYRIVPFGQTAPATARTAPAKRAAIHLTPSDVSAELRNLIGVEHVSGMRNVAPIVASLLDLDGSEHSQATAAGVYLRKHIVGIPIDGWILKSWRGQGNERLFAFRASDRENAKTASDTAQIRRELRALSQDLEGIQKRIAALLNATA